MQEYIITIDLISEMMFGSGTAIPGSIDMEIRHDEYGIPYLQGKTIKGKLREELNMINRCIGEPDGSIILDLFGKPDGEGISDLAFSDVVMDDYIVHKLKTIVDNKSNNINGNDVLNAMTCVRSYTSIDENTGVAKEGSLRLVRMINRGYTFKCKVYTEKELSKKKENALGVAVASLRHIGMQETRGKGEVICRLIKDGNDITNDCVMDYCGEDY